MIVDFLCPEEFELEQNVSQFHPELLPVQLAKEHYFAFFDSRNSLQL
jgi:hypothetical protein